MNKKGEQTLVSDLLEQVQCLIDAPSNLLDAKPHVVALADIYAKLTGVDASASLHESQHFRTENGVAISPVQAAVCLKEPLRTQVFIRGIKQAIEDAAASKHADDQNDAITILYAGTGPYGILLLPLLAMLQPMHLQVCLIDIHQTNVDAINRLVKLFEISPSVVSVEATDACKWQPSSVASFDLVVSETMTHLLRREPQVFIFSHLEQFLKPNGSLIPQRISLTASLVDDTRDVGLGEFFCLDRDSARALRLGNSECYQGQLRLPEHNDLPTDLKLDTDIVVYKDHCLTEHQSSLSIPIYIKDLYFGRSRSIPFRYMVDDEPNFVFDVPKYEPDPILCLSSDMGDSGLMHLKRFWHKAQLDKTSSLEPQLREDELGMDVCLVQECGGSFHDWFANAFQPHPPSFEQFERWVVDEHGLTSHSIERINNVMRFNYGGNT